MSAGRASPSNQPPGAFPGPTPPPDGQQPKAPGLPRIQKTLPCLRCGANTDQVLTPTLEGASWVCSSCAGDMPAFTHAQMQEIVLRKVFHVPETPTPVTVVPPGLRVFLEYHGDVPEGFAKEKEVSEASLLEHAQITGAWPEVGKPLFAVPGSKVKARALAIPYGKVVRVEGLPAPAVSP
jgi:hypothetical protein